MACSSSETTDPIVSFSYDPDTTICTKTVESTQAGAPMIVTEEDTADECCKRGDQDSDDTLLMACDSITDEIPTGLTWDEEGMTCTAMFDSVTTLLLSDGSQIGDQIITLETETSTQADCCK